jgi:hypothetical protein
MPDGPPSQRGLLGTHSAGSKEVDSVFLGLDRSVSSLVIRLVLTASNSPKHGRAPIEGWVKRLSSPFGGESAVGERDVDAGAAEVDHRDQRVGGVEAVCAV